MIEKRQVIRVTEENVEVKVDEYGSFAIFVTKGDDRPSEYLHIGREQAVHLFNALDVAIDEADKASHEH